MSGTSVKVKALSLPDLKPGISRREAALLCIEHEPHIPVYPCAVNDKIPLLENWQNHKITTREQVDEWWPEGLAAEEYANIGFCPGAIDLGVVDQDGEAGLNAWEVLSLTFDTPPTYTVRTPRGGLHLYYAAENFPSTGYAPGRKRCVGEHIDTRGVGGNLLLPPSNTEHGTYEVIDDREPAPMPDWIIEKLAPVVRPQRKSDGKLDLPYTINRMMQIMQARVNVASRLPNDEAARYVSVERRGGDNHLIEVCYELRDAGLSESKIPEVLKESGWNAACRPPWSEGELQTKAENAYKYPQNKEPGTERPKSASESFKLQREKHAAGEAKVKSRIKEEGFGGSRLVMDSFDTIAMEPTTWLWDRRILEGALTMFTGQGDMGKSTVLIDIAARITTGANWPDGSPGCEPGEVIMVGSEQGAGRVVKPKFVAMGGDIQRLLRIRHTIVNDGEKEGKDVFDIGRDLDELDKAVRHMRAQEKRVGAVIFDPLNTYLGGYIDEMSNIAVRRVLEPLAAWCDENKIAVLGNGHVTKAANSGNVANRHGGTRAVADLARGMFLVGLDPADRDARIMIAAKRNEGQDPRGMRFRFEKCNVLEPMNGKLFPSVKLGWDAVPVDITPEAVMAASDGMGRKDGTQKDNIQEVARPLLTEMARRTNLLMQSIRSELGPIPDRTIRYALSDMGAKHVQVGQHTAWTILPGCPMPLDVLDAWLAKSN